MTDRTASTTDAAKRNAETYPAPSAATVTYTVGIDTSGFTRAVERVQAQMRDWRPRFTIPDDIFTEKGRCICAACQPDYRLMRVCATCGNKRCPGAADHRNTCTGSNEPGQPGSMYADPPPVPTPTLKPGDRVAVHCDGTTRTLTVPRPHQENPMTAKTRHDELKALLSKISEESVTTSNVLADVLDLLRERLPERTEVDPDPDLAPADDGLAEWERELLRPDTCCGKCPPIAGGGFDCTCEGNPRCKSQSKSAMTRCAVCETERPLGAECSVCETAPADDLPGEPVEPGDLRAGDKVAFTWWGVEHSTCTLVSVPDALRSDAPVAGGFAPNVVWRDRWDGGISDVRLLERAPREDDDSAFDNAMRTIATLEARAKKAETERDEWREVAARYADGRDKWQAKWRESDEARERAEAERDEWKARHEALREDVETRWAFVDDNFLKDILHSILKGDDERAKGEPR